jgi:hypothetical protein
LVTVVLAITLWSWASMVGTPSTIIDTGTADARRSPPASDIGTASTASDGKPAADVSVEVEGPHPGQREDDQDTAPDEPDKPDEHDQQNRDGHDAQDPPDPGDASSSPELSEEPSAPSYEDDEDGGGQERAPDYEDDDGLDGGNGLFSGLLGMLFGGG